VSGNRDSPRFVVLGDNPLAYRLVSELVSRFDAEVAVVLGHRHHNQGPKMAALPGVRLVEARHPDEAALRAAGVADAHAMALVDTDEVESVHAALAAQDLNPAIRLVIRMNPRLGGRIRTLFKDCAVLSASQVAAPSFVAAALGEDAPNHVELSDTTLYTARRPDVPNHRIVCGLADTTVAKDDSDLAVRLLPLDPDTADLILAMSDNEPHPLEQYRRSVFLRRTRQLLRNKLVLVMFTAIILIVIGLGLLATVAHRGWGEAVYESLIDAAGDAQVETDWNWFDKTLQLIITYAGLALIPIITAVAIDGLLRARLADQGPDPARMDNHVVVVGLGNVGTRVVMQLHDLGIPVVAVDSEESARGVAVARGLGVPVVIGDATWFDTLHAVSVGKARSLVLLTNNDVRNLEVALLGRSYREDLRVVLRLFDDDFAERVERRLGIAVSRSVSRLAAPTFAAAMVERQVIGTISVGRTAVMIADVPVDDGSALVGKYVRACNLAGGSRVLAVRRHADGPFDWKPALDYRLQAHDRLVIAATRSGLGHLLASSIPPEHPVSG